MIDVNKQLKIAVKTGNLEFGCRQALTAARAGKAKLIILASNCPEAERSDIVKAARMSQVAIHEYASSSLDLGIACEKPYPISALTVKEPGDSEILKLSEKQDVRA